MNSSSHTWLLMIIVALLICGGCSAVPQRLETGESLFRWNQEITQVPLRLRLEGAKPIGPGPYPTIIVHPGRGQSAADLRHVVDDFACQGYLAIAVDYLRLIDGSYSSTMFPWRDNTDATRVLDMILNNPWIDRDRVATVGFSLGGAHSLLLAANNPQIKAVVAYYPMSDFVSWVEERKRHLVWRMAFAFVRNRYNAESPQSNDATHKKLLFEYSAINHAEKISAPVLIIHGDNDSIVPLHHSLQLEQALTRNGTISQLLIIDGAEHGFNLPPTSDTRRSWRTALYWLGRYLAFSHPLLIANHGIGTPPGSHLEDGNLK